MKNTNITEGQKRMLMFILTFLICILVVTMGIMPMNEAIEENMAREVAEKARAEEMRMVIDDVTLEPTYEKLKTESQLIFERNYLGFKANEKIEEILQQYNVSLDSLRMSEYTELSEDSYIMNIVQPQTPEEYVEMRSVIRGPLMKLFLVSQVEFSAAATEEQFYQVLNAINNIAPQGPGETDMPRYCTQIPRITLDREDLSLRFVVNMYGMKPPPIDAVQTAEDFYQ